MGKKYTIISILLTILVCISLVYFSGHFRVVNILSERVNRTTLYEKARVLDVKSEQLSDDPAIKEIKIGYQEIEIEILSGKFKNQRYKIKNSMSRLYNIYTEKDMLVIAGIFMDSGKVSDISIYSYKRDTTIYVLAALYFLIILLIGRLKGLKSIISLMFSVLMIICFMMPLIFKGISPIIAAILTSAVIISVTHLLITGWNKRSVSAILGTILSSIITGLICYLSGVLANLSGLTMENAENIFYIAENSTLNFRGLMFSAAVIPSTGAIINIGASITSTIFNMYDKNYKLNSRQLFNSGMDSAKDFVGTMANILPLTLLGSSLPLIIMIMSSNMPYLQLINMDIIATELLQSISGSIGIALTVPITALVSVCILKSKEILLNAEKNQRTRTKI